VGEKTIVGSRGKKSQNCLMGGVERNAEDVNGRVKLRNSKKKGTDSREDDMQREKSATNPGVRNESKASFSVKGEMSELRLCSTIPQIMKKSLAGPTIHGRQHEYLESKSCASRGANGESGCRSKGRGGE